MRKRFLLIAIATLIVISFSKSLSAYGVGAYVNGGIGESRLTSYYFYTPPPMYLNYSFKGINYIVGGGLLFDTYLSDDFLFNYRLQLGFDEFRYPKSPDTIYPEYNYIPGISYDRAFRLSLKNTFGIAFFRNNLLRAWAGLSISSVYYPNNLSSDNYHIIIPRLLVPGLVIGLNFHIHKMMSFIIECGLNYEWAAPQDNMDHMNSLNCYLSAGVLFEIGQESEEVIQRRLMLLPTKEIKKQQQAEKENLKQEYPGKEIPKQDAQEKNIPEPEMPEQKFFENDGPAK